MSMTLFRQAVVDWVNTNIEPLEDVRPYDGKVDIDEMMHVSVKTPSALVSVMAGDQDGEESDYDVVGIAIFVVGRDLVNPKRTRGEVTLTIASELHRLLRGADFGYTDIRRGPYDIRSRNLYDLKSQKNNTIIWGVSFKCTVDLQPFDITQLDDLNKIYVDATPVVDIVQPVPIPAPIVTGPNSWSDFVANAASTRYGIACGYNPDDGKIYVGGGRYGTTVTNETDILDLATGLWASGPLWSNQSYYGASVMARDADGVMKLFCFGGAWSASYSMVGTSPRSIVWDPVSGVVSNLPIHTGYYLGSACWDGADSIWLVGGAINGSPIQKYVWVYTISTDTIDTVSKTQLPVALWGCQCFHSAGKIYLSGGYGTAGVSSTTYRYDVANDAAGWMDIGKPMPVGVQNAAYFSYNGHFLVCGGSSTIYEKTVQRFDPVIETWSLEAPLLLPIYAGGGGTHAGNAYVLYGITNTGMSANVEVSAP